jgi:hypothetical protein
MNTNATTIATNVVTYLTWRREQIRGKYNDVLGGQVWRGVR